MTLSSSVVTVGTAQAMVVPPSTDTQRIILQNQQPEGNVGDYSREGYVHMAQSLWLIPTIVPLESSLNMTLSVSTDSLS